MGWAADEGRVPSRPPLACRPSPPQGGRLCVRPLSPISNVAGVSGQSKLPISPLEGEMSGRTEGG
ncbi:MAG: ABC transporter ATP-binding protein, partial [Mesorhizobium sp.]